MRYWLEWIWLMWSPTSPATVGILATLRKPLARTTVDALDPVAGRRLDDEVGTIVIEGQHGRVYSNGQPIGPFGKQLHDFVPMGERFRVDVTKHQVHPARGVQTEAVPLS